MSSDIPNRIETFLIKSDFLGCRTPFFVFEIFLFLGPKTSRPFFKKPAHIFDLFFIFIFFFSCLFLLIIFFMSWFILANHLFLVVIYFWLIIYFRPKNVVNFRHEKTSFLVDFIWENVVKWWYLVFPFCSLFFVLFFYFLPAVRLRYRSAQGASLRVATLRFAPRFLVLILLFSSRYCVFSSLVHVMVSFSLF